MKKKTLSDAASLLCFYLRWSDWKVRWLGTSRQQKMPRRSKTSWKWRRGNFRERFEFHFMFLNLCMIQSNRFYCLAKISLSATDRMKQLQDRTSSSFVLQLRSALDRIDELEASNSHLSKRLDKMKANRNALLAQHWRCVLGRPTDGQTISACFYSACSTRRVELAELETNKKLNQSINQSLTHGHVECSSVIRCRGDRRVEFSDRPSLTEKTRLFTDRQSARRAKINRI